MKNRFLKFIKIINYYLLKFLIFKIFNIKNRFLNFKIQNLKKKKFFWGLEILEKKTICFKTIVLFQTHITKYK